MQQFLPSYEPNEADLVEQALSLPLKIKIEKAVGLLQLWEAAALDLHEFGYWLAYSGGKDSGCILELAKMAGVKHLPAYNVTTLDPPELVRFIRKEHPEVQWQRPEKALLTMMAEDKSNGPPTRLARWCCEKYKEQGGNGRWKILGVRVAESANRKAMWKSVVTNRRGGTIMCPIVYWTDKDVWDFHRLHDIPYCCLYDQGFKRLGCVGCPLAGPLAQRREFDRWPRYEQAWKRAFQRFWDKWSGVPTLKGKRRWFEDFGSWEGLWDWWISGKAAEGGNGCQGEFMFGSTMAGKEEG